MALVVLTAIFLVITVLLFALGVFNGDEEVIVMSFTPGIVLLALGFVWFMTYVGQVGSTNEIIEYQERVAIAEQQVDEISRLVIDELTEYPEFERDAYDRFIESGDPNILLQFPELRSNTVVIEAAIRYGEAIDRAFEEQRGLEQRKRRLRTSRDNVFVPGWGIDYEILN